MEETNTEEVIELKILFNTLKRNKKFILKFIFSGFIFGLIIAICSKKTWEGEFQIVLDDTQDLTFSSLKNSPLEPFLLESKNKLKTEVEILKSPSILMDVFEFVKKDKSLKKGKEVKIKFKSWKQKLDFNLKKGTSILEIIYRDNDKEIILPVLNKISNKYQEYSGRNRQRGLDASLNYSQTQIKIFNEKSTNSIREAQQFASEQDLTIVEGNSGKNSEIPYFINTELIRMEESEKLKNIDFKLKKIKEAGNDPEILLTLVRSIPELVEQGLPQKYDDLTAELLYKRSVFTEEDKSIRDLKREKEFTIQLFKERLKSSLEASKIISKAKLSAAQRPEGVLIKYEQLLRESFRDKKTLEKLEDQYMMVSLENAKQEEPWELITKPTLSQYPVNVSRSLITLMGVISGIFFGIISAVLYENKKGIVYDREIFNKYFSPPIIEDFSKESVKEIEESLSLIVKNNLFRDINSIAFLIIDDEENYIAKNFLNYIKKIFNEKKIVIIKKISESLEYDKLILLTKLGNTKINDLIKIKKNLMVVDKNVSCIFILKD